MAKQVQRFGIFLTIFLIVCAIAPSASALTLTVQTDGSIVFIADDQVLGETTDKNTFTADFPAEKKVERSAKIKVKAEDELGTRFQIGTRSSDENDMTTVNMMDSQKVNDLTVRFDDKESILRKMRREGTAELEQLKKDTEGMSSQARQKMIQEKQSEIELEIQNKELEMIDTLEEIDEAELVDIEITDRVRERGRELEIGTVSGQKARLRGAEFVLNTETGQVTVITPSGNEHVLNHMPDEVIARLVENGRITTPTDEAEIDIEVTNDGSVIQRVKNVRQTRKTLGLFNREVSGDLIVDDATGDTTFVAENTFTNRILRLFE